MDSSRKATLGRAIIDPPEAVAGEFGLWRLTWTAGADGMPAGSGLQVYTDSDSDWGTPQFTDPTAAEYATVTAPDGVFAAIKTTGVKSLQLAIHGRDLLAGESLWVTFGDQSAGSPGSRAQTFAEERRYFWVDVDAEGKGEWLTLDDPPCVRVVAGEPSRIGAVAVPSTLGVGETFRLLLKMEDRWGNPTPVAAVFQLAGEGFASADRSAAMNRDDGGACCIEGLTAHTPGVVRIAVECDVSGKQLATCANPLVVTAACEQRRLFWADPHGGQLVLNDKFADFFRYARDVGGVQFVGFQRNADVMSAEDYAVQQEQERAFDEPGRFAPIPGYEWSGRTWEGGHHNVYFRSHGRPALRNRAAEEMFHHERAQTEAETVEDVFAAYRGTDTIVTKHIGGEHSDVDRHDPQLVPGVEITSTHGSFEWMLHDVLNRRHRLGFLGGSDCYTGRPGDDRPGHQLRRYAKSGLTGVYCEGVSLEAFFEAMRARRTFATTGARLVLHLTADGRPMGEEFQTREASQIAGAVAATAPLRRLELYRWNDCIYRHDLDLPFDSRRVRIVWNGSSRKTSYSGIVWDGVVEVAGAKILDIEPIRFDSPRSHIVDRSQSTVRWHAWGCGYPQGLELCLDGDDARIEVAVGSSAITGPGYGGHGEGGPRRISFAPAEAARLTVRQAELAEHDIGLELGVLDRRIVVSQGQSGGPLAAEFCIRDPQPEAGWNAYWMRAEQTDGEIGWTSPVFVDCAPAGR